MVRVSIVVNMAASVTPSVRLDSSVFGMNQSKVERAESVNVIESVHVLKATGVRQTRIGAVRLMIHPVSVSNVSLVTNVIR